MPTDELEFWERVNRSLDPPAIRGERKIASRYVEQFVREAGDPAEQDDAVQTATADIQQMRAELPYSTKSVSAKPPAKVQEGWVLLADLDAAYVGPSSVDALVEHWRPVVASTRITDLGASPATQGRVTVEFDHRMGRSALAEELNALWPELVAMGYVRRMRPLKARAVALIRHVCLRGDLDEPWRARLATWNEQWAETQPGWTYSDARAFHSAFRREEKRLTGEPYGLDWYYDSVARLPVEEIWARQDAGDRRVIAYCDRLSKRWGRAAFSVPNDPHEIRGMPEVLRRAGRRPLTPQQSAAAALNVLGEDSAPGEVGVIGPPNARLVAEDGEDTED